MKRRLLMTLAVAIAAAVVCAGWWFAMQEPGLASSAGPPVSADKNSLRQALPPTSHPAPSLDAAAATAPTGHLAGSLSRLIENGGSALKLSPAQLAAYLGANRRNAESLLAAFRITGDVALLREAAARFPGNAAVLMELALGGDKETNRRGAIDALRQADPDNALGDYLSALDHLRQGQGQRAFNDLSTAAGKARFDDYATAAMQSAEEAYTAAGFTTVEAKAAAMMGLARKQIQPMRDLSKELVSMQKSFVAAGDGESADTVRQTGLALGQQMQGNALSFIDELVGIAIERQFLDPAADASRRAALEQRIGTIRELSSTPYFDKLLSNADGLESIAYFDRLKLYGEEAAIRWLRERNGKP